MRQSPDPISFLGAITRRRALALFGIGGSAALLAACGGESQPASSSPTAAPASAAAKPSTAAPASAAAPATSTAAPGSSAASAPASVSASAAAKPAAQPKSGGTLRTALNSDVASLDGQVYATNSNESVWLAFDALTAYDDNLQVQGELAESWDVTSDLMQIKLSLRKGVTWHTGREFTSDDVKWNLLRVRDPKNPSAAFFTNQSNWFQTIDLPDKYTVILKSDLPRPGAFDFFEYFKLVDQETAADKTKSVGTGPFSFVEWVTGDHITYQKNKNYWRSGRPYLDGVVVRIYRDPQAGVNALESDAIDVVKDPSLRDFARYKTDAKYQAIVNPVSGQFIQNGFNTAFAPFDNKLVRQAFNYALDRKRIAETALLGSETGQSLPWASSSLGYEAAKNNFFTFDLDKARALLKQAGVADFTTEILPIVSQPVLMQIAQIYQADLAKIGVTLNIMNADLSAFLDSVNNRKYQGLFSSTSSWGQMEPITMFSTARSYDPNGNNESFKSDAYSQLVTQAASEADPSKRKAIYSKINDLMLDESFTGIIAPLRTKLATRSAVHDIGHTLHEAFTFTNTWIE